MFTNKTECSIIKLTERKKRLDKFYCVSLSYITPVINIIDGYDLSMSYVMKCCQTVVHFIVRKILLVLHLKMLKAHQ